MAYDSPSSRRFDATDSLGAVDPNFLEDTGARTASAYGPASHRGSVAGYQEDKDAPGQEDGDAGGLAEESRDRLAVHWVWEMVLLLGTGMLAYLLWRAEPDALQGDSLANLLVFAAAYGLLGLGAGVTMRAGAPNLAIGPVAAASMIYFAQYGAEGVITSTVTAVVAAGVLGAAIAVVIVMFHVPGWAVSLGAAMAVLLWIELQPPVVDLSGAYDPTSQATILFVSVAALGMLGGLLGSLPSVRRAVGRFRSAGDPAVRRGTSAALFAGVAVVLSMIFAIPAGVLLAAVSSGPVTADSGLGLTAIGVAVALVGGTSVFGRRGGVFGGTLAVVALVLFHEYQATQGWQVSLLATTGVALAIGLGVSRLVETFGRPRRDDFEGRFGYLEQDPTHSSAAASAQGGWSGATDSWSSALPAQPTSNHPWEGERWPSR